MVANLTKRPRGRPRHSDSVLSEAAQRMRSGRRSGAQRKPASRLKPETIKRREYLELLGPEATWDHNSHGFVKCGFPDPSPIRDYEKFMEGIEYFWTRADKPDRGGTEPLHPITWDYVWLDWVNGQEGR